MAIFLLKKGWDNFSDNTDLKLLKKAMAQDLLKVVKLLLDKNYTHDKEQIIFYPVINNKKALFDLLLNKATVGSKDSSGELPLSYALDNKNRYMVEKILSKSFYRGKKVSHKLMIMAIDTKDISIIKSVLAQTSKKVINGYEEITDTALNKVLERIKNFGSKNSKGYRRLVAVKNTLVKAGAIDFVAIEKKRIVDQKRLAEIARRKKIAAEKRLIAEQKRLDELAKKKKIEDTYFNADNFTVLADIPNKEHKLNVFKALFDEDVYKIFNLNSNMTPLRKQIFEKTAEFKKKLKKIKKFRKKMLTKEFCIVLGARKGQYNVKKNMYEVKLFWVGYNAYISNDYLRTYSSSYYRGKKLNVLDYKSYKGELSKASFLMLLGKNFHLGEQIVDIGTDRFGKNMIVYDFKVSKKIALQIELNNYFVLKFKIADYVQRGNKKTFVIYDSRLIAKNIKTNKAIYTDKIDNDKKWVKLINDRSIRWKEKKDNGGKIKSEIPVSRKSVNGFSYDNGSLDGVYSCRKGKKHGSFRTYYENGKLKGKGTYRNGKKIGASRTYYESGRLKGKGYFRNDKAHGWFYIYYDNDKLCEKKPYRNGKLHGWSYIYLYNGKLRYKTLYRNGKFISRKAY